MDDDFAVLQKLIQANPEVLNLRVNEETFPPGPEHNVDNIMTFTIGRDSTPLHAAAKVNRPQMARLLIDSGLSPDIRGGYDDSAPLHVAAWHDHPEVAAILIELGADIDLQSGKIHNNSPAGWAIVAGSADVFVLLMDKGAKVFDWFAADAKKAVAGEFKPYKIVPQENYERILARMTRE